MRDGAFPDPDEPIDGGGRTKAGGLSIRPAPNLIVTAPAVAARQTAEILGHAANVEPALADMACGAWRGHSLTDVQASEPEALMAWIQDPASGTPGGESLVEVIKRVSTWMDGQASGDARILAVTHPNVMRAALAHVLDIPAAAAFRIDIAPLSMLTLSFNRQWRVQGLGVEERAADGADA
jgi:broad specificity phosphatase PhoE